MALVRVYCGLASADEVVRTATAKASHDFTAALANDLNTAEARAAIFDVLRAVNTAADSVSLILEQGAERAMTKLHSRAGKI